VPVNYYITSHKGYNFLAIASDNKAVGGLTLDQDELILVRDNLPLADEWVEGVWDFKDMDEMKSAIQKLNIPEGDVAKQMFQDCIDDGFFDDLDDDDLAQEVENDLHPMWGCPVFTVKPENESNDWSDEAKASRKWGEFGLIVNVHNSHGLTYEVRHASDQTIGHYEPNELYYGSVALPKEFGTK
jgi:hypothetical protein